MRSLDWLFLLPFRRLPFTLFVLAALVCIASWHGVWFQPLSSQIRSDLGHAPRHTWSDQWPRIFTSMLVTGDVQHLLASIAMTTLAVGWLEVQAGSKWTALVFLLGHTATILIESTFLAAFASLQSVDTNRWQLADDVGPSAGYYTCLAVAFLLQPTSPRVAMSAIVLVCLLGRLAWSASIVLDSPSLVRADVAHAIAFVVGSIGCLALHCLSPSPWEGRPKAGEG